jgi:hypothetical protein
MLRIVRDFWPESLGCIGFSGEVAAPCQALPFANTL